MTTAFWFSSRNVPETFSKDRQVQKLGGIENVAFAQLGSDNALVGERAGGARHHALAAGNARRLAHRQIVIEGDAGLISLAAAGQHPVVPDLVAAANAAVAQDAGLVVDRDHRRRIVLSARRGAARKAGFGDPGSARPDVPVRNRPSAAAGRRARDGPTSAIRSACGARLAPARSPSSPSCRLPPGECRTRHTRAARHRPRTRGTRPPDFHSADGKAWESGCR